MFVCLSLFVFAAIVQLILAFHNAKATYISMRDAVVPMTPAYQNLMDFLFTLCASVCYVMCVFRCVCGFRSEIVRD